MSDNYEKTTPVDEAPVENVPETVLEETAETVTEESAEAVVTDEAVDGEAVEIELDDLDGEKIDPEIDMTKGEKVKTLLMKPLWSAIVKWVFIFFGIVGVVLYFIANSSREMGETFATTLGGISNGIASFFSIIPIPMFEILICAAAIGILAYLVFIIVRTIQVKGKFHKGGLWVQFGYTILAVAGIFALLSSLCYGIFTYRARISESTDYTSANVTDMDCGETMLYLIDKINNTLYEGEDDIFFKANGESRYASSGRSIVAITKAVCTAFDNAAEDIPTLKGSTLTSKELVFSGLYSKYQISSIYSPFTAELCINTDYPEVVIPMQVAKTMAMQRGYTDNADASFIAFLVLTEYSDDYYLNYSGYFNAYLELSSAFYRENGKNLHLYLANALRDHAKADYVSLVKELDELYGVSSDIEYTASSQTLSGTDYCDVAKLLLVKFRDNVYDSEITIEQEETSNKYGRFCNYLTNYYLIDEDFQYEVDDVYEEYHPDN